ncbi:TrmB family transcriptional regulator [candidate division KSB1 bacterium]
MIKTAQIFQTLESLGLSNYEAKAYLSLLRKNPLTGYQLSKNSGVPRSRIYETLEKLSVKGYILSQKGPPTKYIPINGEEFIQKAENSLNNKIDTFRKWFADVLEKQPAFSGIWSIKGRENILNKANFMINYANDSVVICAVDEDLEVLKDSLENASDQYIDIVVISGGEFTSKKIENCFPLSWDEERKINVRNFALVTDRVSCLIGATFPEEQCIAGLTDCPGIVSVTRNQILHEVVINKLLNYIPPGNQRELLAYFNQYINI